MRLAVLRIGFERGLGQGIDLRGIQDESAGHFHLLEKFVEDAIDAEDLLFADAQKVVVVGGSFDDRRRGVLQAGGFIDHDRRISRPGDDRPLARFHGRPRHRRAAGNDQQRDAAMVEQLLGGFQRRREHAGDEIVDAEFRGDLLVVFADRVSRAVGAAGMGVGDERIARGDHVDRVGRQRRDAVRDRRDDADDAERGEFFQAQAVAAAGGVGLQKFDAGDEFEDLQLFDLVIEPADFGFLQLHRAPLAGVLFGDGLDQLHDRIAIVHRQLHELFLRFVGGGNGSRRSSCNTPWRSSCCLTRCRRPACIVTKAAHHFADHILDERWFMAYLFTCS